MKILCFKINNITQDAFERSLKMFNPELLDDVVYVDIRSPTIHNEVMDVLNSDEFVMLITTQTILTYKIFPEVIYDIFTDSSVLTVINDGNQIGKVRWRNDESISPISYTGNIYRSKDLLYLIEETKTDVFMASSLLLMNLELNNNNFKEHVFYNTQICCTLQPQGITDLDFDKGRRICIDPIVLRNHVDGVYRDKLTIEWIK